MAHTESAIPERCDRASRPLTVEFDTYVPRSTHFGQQYPASKASCPRARRDVAAVLSEIGLTDEGTYAGSVVFAELFTNALLHRSVGAGDRVHIGIHGAEDGQQWVGIAVTDSGRGSLKSAAEVALDRVDFGRGLEVVRGLGARLTDVRLPGAYTVTAWVPTLDELRRRVCRCDCMSVHSSDLSACAWLVEDAGADEKTQHDEDPAAHLCLNCKAMALEAAATGHAAGRSGAVA